MALSGVRVLVVEDEALIMLAIEDMLAALGCEVTSASRVETALVPARDVGLDVALLDVNVGGQRVFPVADALERRGVPFVFATGYGQATLPERFRDRPSIAKPFTAGDLEEALGRALARLTP